MLVPCITNSFACSSATYTTRVWGYLQTGNDKNTVRILPAYYEWSSIYTHNFDKVGTAIKLEYATRALGNLKNLLEAGIKVFHWCPSESCESFLKSIAYQLKRGE